MRVKVLKLGHAATELHNIEPGVSISGVLDETGFGTGASISLNGLGASLEAEVSDGDVVCLVPKVEGGC